ncbi:MAG: TonB-dependent receptor [Cytophagales bacterium]|nr:TonB-dependent receptor [Cytophagales bacterium]
MLRTFLALFYFIIVYAVLAQQGSVFGKIVDRSGEPVSAVNISVIEASIGAVSKSDGSYELILPAGKYTISFSHVKYRNRTITVNINQGSFVNYDVRMRLDTQKLREIEITGDREGEGKITNEISLEGKSAENLPSAFGDFSKILVTLPGVASNNEFSTAYSVRGGNFDENLVYVNDIPVYRPFLSNAGKQEGLSFVNPEMVSNIRFSAGGWEPKYGDKQSSSLNILYDEPRTFKGQVTVGFLGGYAVVKQKVNDRFRFVTGIRHKDSRYLLGTTETKGQYFPTYTDIQSLMTFDLTNKGSNQKNKTKLHWLIYYGRNRYLTKPESQTTQFGSIQANFRIQTAFQGQEILNYDVYQSGVNLSHIWSGKSLTRVILSGVYTREREYFDVEGAYRICDVDNSASGDLNDCVVVRGIGTNYNYGRNRLRALLSTIEVRNEHLLNLQNLFEWGVGIQTKNMKDKINEYSFIDSADFVDLRHSVFNKLSLQANNYTGYLQNTTFLKDSTHAFITGIRFNYWDFNHQLIASPRVSYRVKTNWIKPTTFKLSFGWYQQFPFYRELRTFDGNLRQNSTAQRSVHLIGGMERVFTMWGRPFYINTELYYKWQYNQIPYDIDNVRLRYFDENSAKAYAAGADLRINGEFIPGTQSWFSLGLLTTRENIQEDDRNFIRRPTDQRVNMAIYFEDHMPSDPSLRIYLNMVYGSGYPIGPPDNLSARNIFSGDQYYRADIGLSKRFDMISDSMFRAVWLRLEILNALGADNTLSYSWIEDVGGNQFAIPNSLSARFLNIKLSTEF